MAWTKRQPISQSAPLLPEVGVDRQEDGGDGEDGEARVVDLHPAEHVAQPAQGDDEDRLHEAVAHDHPEQEGDVAGSQRVEMDAAEDGGQGDDDDGAVEHGHEGGSRRVGQGGPLVAVVELGSLRRSSSRDVRGLRRRHQMLSASRSISGAATWSCLSSARVKLLASACDSSSLRALRRRPEQLLSRRGQREDGASAVGRVGLAGHQPALLEGGDRRPDRLGADAFQPGQLGRRGRPGSVETGQRRGLRRGQVTLDRIGSGAVAGPAGGRRPGRHRPPRRRRGCGVSAI